MRRSVWQKSGRLLLKSIPQNPIAPAKASPSPMFSAMAERAYDSWTREQLVSRVTELEKVLRKRNANSGRACENATENNQIPSTPKKPARVIDPSRYSSRLIALKLAYFGQGYNGFEHHTNNVTRLPTVEEELWKAMMKVKIIFPHPAKDASGRDLGEDEVNWEGCEYSKCGRTDRGVSAFGQVIGLRVRSNRPVAKQKGIVIDAADDAQSDDGKLDVPSSGAPTHDAHAFDDVRDEIPYIHRLNGVLPDDIRILAWCPSVPEDFSARFSCRGRQYRYFFSNPGFLPVPTSAGLYKDVDGRTRRDGWLDIAKMREAASYLVGEHDFRNFCKIDADGKVTTFRRNVVDVKINALETLDSPRAWSQERLLDVSAGDDDDAVSKLSTSRMYCLELHGSAFLWHQIRHIMAILFLVGQGYEKPSIVLDLLNVERVRSRPNYEMASDAPLVLWDCIFPKPGAENQRQDGLDWVYADDPRLPFNSGNATSTPAVDDRKFGLRGVMVDMWKRWRERKLEEVLVTSFIDVVEGHPSRPGPIEIEGADAVGKTRPARLFMGENYMRQAGKYVPVLERERWPGMEKLQARPKPTQNEDVALDA